MLTGAPLKVKLFNTLTRSVEEVLPLKPGELGIYCCGPTVYDYQHLGNFKTFLFEDFLVRSLRLAGYQVKHVMNITDVGHLVGDGDEGEDKMLVAARREKKKSFEIAEYYTNKFFEDWDKLNLTRPSITCKATDHVQEMIALIQDIERNGATYVSGGNVYFDVSKCTDYGKLAKLDLEGLKAGARITVDPNKRNPLDFVLWFTKSKFENQELLWDSPWGRGYPGWHIECSAMSIKYLGSEFDIHCGGIDHIPVHHTNEIAQSEAATKKPWVRMWLHSEFIMLNAEKMAKSKGKALLLDDVIERGFEPLAFRYLCLSSHYRSHLNFTWDILANANSSFQKLKQAVITLKQEGASTALPAQCSWANTFREALCDDLNIPRALANVWSTLGDKSLNSGEKLAVLYYFDQVLGLGMETWAEVQLAVPPEVQALVAQREEARKKKDWAEADRLRKSIGELGYAVTDVGGGSKVAKL